MKHNHKAKNLSPHQSAVVRRGQKAGLTEKQIAIFANPAFSPAQMEQIRLGLLDNLTPAEIRVFADPLVSSEEMARIRKIYRLSAEIEQGMGKLTQMVENAEQRANSLSKSNSTHRTLDR